MSGLLETIEANTGWALGTWHWEKLACEVPNPYKSMPQTKFYIGEEDDIAIWEPAKKGDFSIKSAWEFWRVADVETDRLQWVWYKVIPTKIQVFNWKVWKNIITVDSTIAKFVCLPSKCSCCENNQYEIIDHLLVNGELATKIWRHFSSINFIQNQSYWTKQGTWLQGAKKTSQMGVECMRNSALLVANNYSDSISIQILQLQNRKALHRRVTVVRWIKPPAGFFKLNTDGSSVNGACGAGGIVRNYKGEMMPFRRVQHPLHFDYINNLWFIEQAQHEIDTYGTDESGNLKLFSFRNMKEKCIQKFERNVSLKCLRNNWLNLKKKYKNWVTLTQLAGECYNEVTGTFSLIEPEWVEILEVLPEARVFKHDVLRHREKMTLLFSSMI
ncbi:hypothetical protein GIB67_011848 [Kingdonia uniflora]|uniref:Reverse transcriptase zinc-binding domain-containing protein n=1 Tax=Kingdonia uniflora TaxID=39325 RepID=A0A7J7NXL8_9MAGN|nr:hypothetical protein GIB67_011848 [Kingdonia uniflora]